MQESLHLEMIDGVVVLHGRLWLGKLRNYNLLRSCKLRTFLELEYSMVYTKFRKDSEQNPNLYVCLQSVLNLKLHSYYNCNWGSN